MVVDMTRIGPALLFLILFVSGDLVAQPNANLKAMVDAEKAFIDMARTQNRRDAFLYFLGDSAVTQGPNGPVKGKTRLQQQPVTDDWLDWEVGYSDIAASGDFGFNTGPWRYHRTKNDTSPLAFGEFNSVWKRQADGTWKNVLDIGISHGPPKEAISWSSSTQPLHKSEASTADMLQLEKEFQANASINLRGAYRRFLSAEARMMVSGQLPFVGGDQQEAYLAAWPPASGFRPLAGEIAQSNDLGYVYGTAAITLTGNGATESKTATFVRIWKREADGWKIVLDVLSF